MNTYVLQAKHPNPVLTELNRNRDELIQDLAANRLSSAEINAARKLGGAFLRIGHASTNARQMTVIAKTLFPQEARLEALNRMIEMLAGWQADSKEIDREANAAHEKRLALKRQHSLGVSVYWGETEQALRVVERRIKRWVESEGLSESGVPDLQDLIQRGHKREQLIKLYPPRVTLEDLRAEEARLLGILASIEEFNKSDIPTREFLDSMPQHLRDLRPRNWIKDVDMEAL